MHLSTFVCDYQYNWSFIWAYTTEAYITEAYTKEAFTVKYSFGKYFV